jgi:type II secretory pathway component PulK
MKTKREKGFILILVVLLIELTAIILYILTDEAQTMLYQANSTHLQACQRNLTASGLAWAKINLQKESSETSGKMIELDVTEMDIRGSSLAVNLSHPAQTQPQVRIRTSCSRGRKTLTSNKSYTIRP